MQSSRTETGVYGTLDDLATQEAVLSVTSTGGYPALRNPWHWKREVETFARVLVVAGCPLANQIVAAYQAKGIPAEIVR